MLVIPGVLFYFIAPLLKSYLLSALPATFLKPVFDLNPVISYEAVNVKLAKPAVVPGKLSAGYRMIVEKDNAGNRIEWTIKVGASEIYSKMLSCKPLVQKHAGVPVVVCSRQPADEVRGCRIGTYKTSRLNYINTTTVSMVNTCRYTVVFTSPVAQVLSINALDGQ